MADKVEILLQARGGRQVATESRVAAGGIGKIERSAVLAHRATGKLATGLHALGRGALYAGGAVAAGLVVEVKRGTDAWEEHRKIAADTTRVLRTTGGVANVTAKHIDTLVGSIQRKTAVDRDQIQAGQNILLSMTGVRNEAGKGNKVFDRATKLAVDMSARFGGDTKRAFIQLGKALDGPTKGITALRRAGVTFTDAEQKKIKALESSGHLLDAQRLILDKLDKKVGGSAAAQATPIAHLKTAWHELEKELGEVVSPTVDKVAGQLQHLADDAARIMGRHDLTWQGKLKLFTQKDLEPEAKKLGKSLERGVEWAAPQIATGLAHAAPRAASMFLHAWLNADAWGKLLTVSVLAKKLGVFGGVAKLLTGGGKLGGALGDVAPVRVFVVNPGFNGGPGGGKVPGIGAWGRAARIGGGIVGVGAAVELLHLINDISHGHTNTRGVGMTAPARTLRNRQGQPTALVDRFGHATPINVDPRLAGYPDSHMASSASRLFNYPDSHALSSLARLPERTANAVAHRPLNVRTAVTVMLPDGEVLARVVAAHPTAVANAVADTRLHYKERG